MRAATSRCLSLIHGHWTASAAIPLPSFYITYLFSLLRSHHSPTSRQALQRVGRLLKKIRWPSFPSVSIHLLYKIPSGSSSGKLCLSFPRLLLSLQFSKKTNFISNASNHLCHSLGEARVCKLQPTFPSLCCFSPFYSFHSPSLLLIILSFQFSHTPPWSNLKCKPAIQSSVSRAKPQHAGRCFCCTVWSHEVLIEAQICTYRSATVNQAKTLKSHWKDKCK